MKKFFSISLILLLLLNSVSLLFYYAFQIQLCKIEAKNFVHSNEISQKILIQFSSSQKNFKLIGEHEIKSNGKMFDIVKIERTKNGTIYFAYSDDKEDDFFQKINELSKNNSASSPLTEKKFNVEILKYINQKNYCDNSMKLFARLNSQNICTNNFCFYSSPFIKISSPPPKVVA